MFHDVIMTATAALYS